MKSAWLIQAPAAAVQGAQVSQHKQKHQTKKCECEARNCVNLGKQPRDFKQAGSRVILRGVLVFWGAGDAFMCIFVTDGGIGEGGVGRIPYNFRQI